MRTKIIFWMNFWHIRKNSAKLHQIAPPRIRASPGDTKMVAFFWNDGLGVVQLCWNIIHLVCSVGLWAYQYRNETTPEDLAKKRHEEIIEALNYDRNEERRHQERMRQDEIFQNEQIKKLKELHDVMGPKTSQQRTQKWRANKVQGFGANKNGLPCTASLPLWSSSS